MHQITAELVVGLTVQNTLLIYWFKLHGVNYRNLFAALAIQYCWSYNIAEKLADNCLFLSGEWYKLYNNKHLITSETSGMFDSTYFDNWNQRSFFWRLGKLGCSTRIKFK